MDAYLEFLNENSRRAYPFLEDTLPGSGGWSLPQDLFVDLSGYSLLPVTGLRLKHFSGSASGATGTFAPVGGLPTFFFELISGDQEFIIAIPLADPGLGVRATGTLGNPGDSGVSACALVLTLGDGALPPDDEEHDFGDTANVEPGLVFDMSGSQVNMLEVLRDGAADYRVHGDVKIRGGYNMEVVQSNGGLTLTPYPGGGELGSYEGQDGEASACDGLVLAISGVRPNTMGEFRLIGGPGIVVEDFPLENKIVVTANPSRPTQPNC